MPILTRGNRVSTRESIIEIPIGVGTVSFSLDGSKFAWGLELDYGTRLWDRDSDQQITLRETGHVAFSPDGLTLAIGHRVRKYY